MKQLLYLVISLIVIAAIIPPAASAVYYDFNHTTFPAYIVTNNTWYTYTETNDAASADAVCKSQYGPSASLFQGGLTYCNSSTFLNSYLGAMNNGSGCANWYAGAPAHRSKTYYSGNTLFVWEWISCAGTVHSGGAQIQDNVWFRAINVSQPNTLINFTATPLTGSAPLPVSFTVLNYSVANPLGVTFAYGDGQSSGAVTTGMSNHTYAAPGNYTVVMTWQNLSGMADTITKLNYINVGAFNATKTKYFQTIDGTNGNIVLNSSIQLKDVENSSWVNATGLTADGMSSITTLLGHHVSAYAQALGYSDADDLNILNDGEPRYIMMWPTFAKNVSAGNVSLYVTVKDKDTHANIVGAGVTASLASGSMSTTTNEAGIAYFIVKNSSTVLITAQAIGQGYQTATTTINTGTASGGSASAAATILLGKNTVTPVFSTVVTTLPGGGTPTPVVTILPGCEDTISAAGQEKCRAAQSNQSLSWLSGNLFGLVQICFVVTILYLLGIKLGK